MSSMSRPTFFDRRIEQDLTPLIQRLTVLLSHQITLAGLQSERTVEDVAKAALVALASAARGIREVADLPVEAWAEANRIAGTPTSLTNTAPTLPAVAELHDQLQRDRNMNAQRN